MPSILILGAGSDIAKAIARQFAKNGYAVLLAGRKMEQIERLQKDLINRYQCVASVHHFDATQFSQHGDFVRSLPDLPDIVVYSAGFMCTQSEAQEDWSKTRNLIEVNYSGAVSILNVVAVLFKERGNGCIIGISSVAGERGRASNYLYGSSKAAFTAYLSGLRNEMFAFGVRVVTIKPGFVYTKMTHHLSLPARLTAQPAAVAEKVYKAVLHKKDVVYFKPVWRWIMFIIRHLPEPVFKRLKL